MGNFDYSLDLGADLNKLSKITDLNKESELVDSDKPLEKPQYIPKLSKTYFFMLLILLIIGFKYLTLTSNLSFFDIQADLELNAHLTDSISSRKLQINPLLSKQSLDQEIKDEMAQVKKTSAYQEQLKNRIDQLKNWYKDNEGQPYLFKVDPYYYYRMANQYVMWGSFDHPNTKNLSMYDYYTDPLRSSPRGETSAPTLLSYFIVYFYKTWSLFSNVSVMTAAFYLPVLFGLLSIICFFFIAHKLFNNDIITFCASLLFTLSQRFFVGNFAGNVDTQILAMFFTLLVFLIFVYFIDFSNKIRSILLFLLFYPVLVLFSEGWPSGWKYVYVIIFGFVIIYFFFKIINQIINKNFNYWTLTGLIIPLLFINQISSVINRGLEKVIIKGAESNVGELMPSSWSSIVESLGGPVLVYFALFTLMFLVYTNFKKPDKYELFVIVWFIPMLIAGVLSRRFTYFIAPSFALLAGYGFFYVYPYLIKTLENFSLPINKKYNKWLVCAVLSIFIFTVLIDDILASRTLFPEVNDAIANTASFINENSNESAIIITGMNRGYIWQALAMRGTIIDGANWGLDKEKELYTVLTNERTELYPKLSYLLSTYREVPSFKNGFESLKNLTINISEQLPESFIVIDKDTFNSLSKYYLMTRTDAQILEESGLDVNSLTVSELYDCYPMQDGKQFCGAKFVVDVDNLNATQQGFLHPNSLVVVKNGIRREKVFDKGIGDFTLFVFEGNNGYQSFMVDKKLKNTLTARFYSGEQIPGFEIVHLENLPERVITYKVLWE